MMTKSGWRATSFSGGCLWAAAGAGFGMLATVVSLLSGGFVRAARMSSLQPTPAVTIIAVPTATSTLLPSTVTPTLLPTSTAQATQDPGAAQAIRVGMLVEVFGTETEGVRIRQGPGLASEMKFLGLDSEVFQVVEGPAEMDGFVWWSLQNPYDLSKAGWAVADFLRPLSTP